MKIQNSHLIGRKRSFFGHAVDQMRRKLLGISWKDCVPGSCFSFFCPQLAQLDNTNKGPTSPCNFHLPGIVVVEASAKL